MSLKNLTHILVFLSLILLSISPPSAKAATLSGSDTDSSDGCTGSWTFPPLSVGGEDGVVFAQAAYEFDENCNPVLANQIRLNYVPDSVLHPEQKPFETKTVPNIPPPPPYKGGASIEAVDTCHLRTWEEDAPGLDMIAVLVDQTYSWNGSTVTLSNGSTTATTYFSWWHLDSGPTGTAGYHSSQVAWSNGEASFYCDGAPFCSGGRAYDITLYDYMTVDYQGGCGGYGTYSGTVVPLGRVLYNVWQ